MGIYNIQFQDSTVKVRVVDRADIFDMGLSELKSQMGTNAVVGLVIEFNCSILQLCAGSVCLVVLLRHMEANIPQSLRNFLADSQICFVGVNMRHNLYVIAYRYLLECRSGVEVGELAARVLKKPGLSSSGLPALAAEVGLSLVEPPCICMDSISQTSRFFSHEQIKILSWKVVASYMVGKELLLSL